MPPAATPEKKEYGGAIFDFWSALGGYFTPAPTCTTVPGWATNESRAKYPRSLYTACVYDVGVGNFDACVADMWMTPERTQLAHFLPAVRNDNFYLVVPRRQDETTIWTMLRAPFRPLTAAAWLAVCGVLAWFALLNCTIDFLGQKPPWDESESKLRHVYRQLYSSLRDFLRQDSSSVDHFLKNGRRMLTEGLDRASPRSHSDATFRLV